MGADESPAVGGLNFDGGSGDVGDGEDDGDVDWRLVWGKVDWDGSDLGVDRRGRLIILIEMGARGEVEVHGVHTS